ncbi:MAG: methyltransferase [bacterium]|nr:MAG: methyltransferase [bacterium]
MDILDSYYKKTINFDFKNTKLKFKVSQPLFSSHIIDLGTQRLLRTFLLDKLNYKKVLDLGCGYGPIGITLKALMPNSEIHMTDRDALAIKYSGLNAELNNLSIPEIYGSLGYDSIETKDFDLIMSNIPAKVGFNVLSHMLLDAKYFLREKGLVAIVVVDAILDDVEKILSDPNIEIILKKSWNGHTVFHYKFILDSNLNTGKCPQSFNTGLYDRDEYSFNFLGKTLKLKTTYNLPEFDEIGHNTQMLLNNLENIKGNDIQNCAIYNIHQGHIPVAVSSISNLQILTLIDRNLQSLVTTSRNLKLNGLPEEKIILKHQVDLTINSQNIDCFIAIIDKKEGRDVNQFLIKQVLDQLSKNGRAYLESTSNITTQIEKLVKRDKRISILKRAKYRGESFLSFEKKTI